MGDNNLLVSQEQMEGFWASIRQQNDDPRAGILGPGSMSWKIDREAALFLGAGRAALLQLAHPWVAASLDQHSNLRADPLARFHNTFRVVFTIIFGTLEQALAASRHLYLLHTRIRGKLPESVASYQRGSHYEANEVNALLWVYATLVESGLMAYASVLPPLSSEERELYYTESRKTAPLFGIRADALPPNWEGFQRYTRDMCESETLGVSALSREMAQRVLHGRGSWLPVPEWYRALTTAWMPERLREEFGLAYGSKERDAAARAMDRLPRIYRRLPAMARFVGPYREAQARLRDRGPGPTVGLSNRFWIGQPRMMFSELGR